MDFELTPEQRELKQAVRRLAEREFRPKAARWDEEEAFPWENIPALRDAGLLGLALPEAYGGAGGTVLDLALVMEELARCCVATAFIVGQQNGVRGQGHRALRHRGAARGAPARDRPRRAAHRVGHDRAGRGLGPAPPRLPRAPRRRPLRDRREQDLLLPGRGLASQRGDLPLRRRRGVPGPGRAARRGRRARLLARARHPGDGAARHRHGRPGLRELPRAREPIC